MDVISISSGSDNGGAEGLDVDVNQQNPNDEVFTVDWNDDDDYYPSINYESDEANNDVGRLSNPEVEIENHVTPLKSNKENNDKNISINEDQIEKSIYDIIDSSYSENAQKCTLAGSPNSKVSKKNTDSTSESDSPSKSVKRKAKLSQEEKESARLLKEQRKLEKEKLREEKKLEQNKQKAYKITLSANKKYLKPEENIKFLKVHIDNQIINSTCGGNIIPVLQQNSIQYEVEAQRKSFTITWSKKRQEKIVNEVGDIIENVENVEENQLLYVLEWDSVLELVHNKELLSHVVVVKSAYMDKKTTLIIYGLKNYFEYKKHKRNKDFKAGVNNVKKVKTKYSERVFENAPDVSKDQLEFALTELHLVGKFNYRLLETPEEFSSLVLNFTKSLSQIDYKLDKIRRQEENVGWISLGDSIRSVKVEKNGEGLLALWQQQITQFSSVGLDTAQALVSHFKSPLALVTEYENCTNPSEGELLLQNIQTRRGVGILSVQRRIGPSLSKKIYNFFTSDDPELEL